MTYRRATWLADVLRAAGCRVVEHDGWKARGLIGQSFDPKALVWHHDASAKGASPGVPAYMLAHFQTAAAQLWVASDGTWHVLASGRAPHAGVVRPGAPSNYTSLGIETDHTVGETWPPAMLASLRVGSAAILVHLGVPASKGLHFHKSIAFPPGRKVDPAGLTLKHERGVVAALMVPPKPPTSAVDEAKPTAPPKHATPTPKPKVSLRNVVAAAKADPKAAQGHGLHRADVLLVEKALCAEGLLDSKWVDGAWGSKTVAAYKAWQKRCGYTGKGADGIPGARSLTRLGAKHGWTVVS